MTNDVAHPFMCLFAIYIGSLVKYLFKSLVHFQFCLFNVDFWEFFKNKFVDILSSLLGIQFASILSHL